MLAAILLSAGASVYSQELRKPAAREHVREVMPGQGAKYISRLATIVELNITMGNGTSPARSHFGRPHPHRGRLFELDAQYKRKGGNLYSYLYRVGAGPTSYILAGHENDELLVANSGFGGGVGDYDRYLVGGLWPSSSR